MQTVGNLIVYESPDSPEWKFGDSDSCVRTFTGPYASLFSMRPKKGDPMDGTGDMMIVQDSTLKRQKLNQGILTVNLIGKDPSYSLPSSPNNPLKTLVEIDWVAVQKDLRTSPFWDKEGSSIDFAGWARIDKWKNEPDAKLKVGGTAEEPIFKFKDQDESEVTLNDAESLAAKKILKGGEGYNVYAPVVKKTSTFAKQPSVGEAGFKVDHPDVASAEYPEGYQWLKTACRDVQSQDKTWQRTEEWTGADEVDGDLYPTQSPSGKVKSTEAES